jgi:multiple sugar transport system permease protein
MTTLPVSRRRSLLRRGRDGEREAGPRTKSTIPPALRRKRRREWLTALGFLTPWIVGFSVFFIYPLIATVVFSFERYNLINSPTWVGLSNWRYILTQYPDLVTALENTLWLVVVMVTLQTIFGLGVAMLVVKIKNGGGFFRTIFYLPNLAPPVVATLGFVFLLNPNGPVNSLLSKIGISPPDWFNDPSWSKPGLTLLALWGIGNVMVIFMASLLDVPQEQYEAASLDGAGPIQRFRYVTVPHISPVILFSVVTGVISTLQYYTQAIIAGETASGRVMTAGTTFSPGYPQGSTLTMPQLVWNEGFNNYDTGGAAVLALILFAIAMLFTAVLLRRKSGFMGGD